MSNFGKKKSYGFCAQGSLTGKFNCLTTQPRYWGFFKGSLAVWNL